MVSKFSLQNYSKKSFVWIEHLPTLIRLLFKVHIFWEGHKILQSSTVDLSYVVPVKSMAEILQNSVPFSEYMNFKTAIVHCAWARTCGCVKHLSQQKHDFDRCVFCKEVLDRGHP
jgi:hypothetical protein